MSLNQYIQKIDRYLSKEDGLPLVVDVQNYDDQRELVQHYNVGKNILIPALKYCSSDEMPRNEELLNDLSTVDGVMIVTGVTSYLKLYGERELQRFLRKLLSMSIKDHVVFISYQCRRYLPVSDKRFGRRIIVVENTEKKIPDIVFIDQSIPLSQNSEFITGIDKFSEVVKAGPVKTIYVVTKKSKDTFPFSLYNINSLKNSYDVLLQKDDSTKELPEETGTSEQWDYALELFDHKSNWADVIDSEFGSHTMLEHIFSSYTNFTENRKWLFFIALKMFGDNNNWCLTTAARKASSVNNFNKQVYRCILDKSPDDTEFWKYYESRKKVLEQIGNPSSELSSYCKVVFSKGINAIFYLTDNTQKEQESIFAFLDQYGLHMDRNKLINILSKVFPALYQYLLPYRFGNPLLDQYFQDYKFQKVINKILPEFESEVKEQAEKREYNYILPPRSSVIESLNRKDAQLYFMDAMGVEFLGYIVSVCKEFKLLSNIKVCVAELPSITSKNKEFVDLFADSKYQTVSIKDIDDIKHHGKYDFDFYRNSKLPIHLIKELEVIRKALEKIRNDLLEGQIKRVFMISDHGSSRLAVLYDTENVWEMAEKGLHSGRCCLKSDVDSKPDFVADAGDFWALANYDRFKGGRKANVEVHGGATLEELCVPIIELIYMSEKPEIALMPVENEDFIIGEIPEIEVSFRKKAALIIFSSVSLQNVCLNVNGSFYPAVDIGNNCYRVDMPELKKHGSYYADVCSGDNVIAEQLPFVIKKEGQIERELL